MQTNEEAEEFIAEVRRQPEISNLDNLGFLTLISVGLSAGSIVIGIALLICYFAIANRAVPVMVQLANGGTMKVATLNDKERTPAVIKTFVAYSMTKLMTWRTTLPPESTEDIAKPKLDPGIVIPGATSKEGGRIPTSAWQGSFALSDDFQNPFLKVLATLTSKAQAGKAQTTLEILDIGEPISTGSGSWKVPMIATLVILQPNNPLPQRKEFNKEIFVQAIPVPKILEDNSKTGEKKLTELMAEARATGLQIFAIRDYRRTDIAPKN